MRKGVIKIDKLKFQLQDMNFMTNQKHSNVMYFEAAVTKIDTPSDGIAGGTEACSILERQAVEKSMSTMNGMPINVEFPDDYFSNPAEAFTEHNSRFCIGVVQNTWIDGDYLMCSGILWKDNFPDVCYMIQNAKDSLGASIECYMLQHQIQDDGYEHVSEMEFLGFTICWQNVAAFSDTFISKLVATINNRKDDLDMTKEEMQELLNAMKEEIKGEFTTKLQEQEEKLKLEATKSEEVKANEQIAKLEATNAELKAELEKLQASTIPAPTAVQTAAKKDGDKVDYMGELDKINKMTCSVDEKMKLRFALALKMQ